jgi:DNA repair exonuclease SbcCD nuclease subunit
MPYPTPTRYLRGEEVQRYGSLEEKNQRLHRAYAEKLQELLQHPSFNPSLPTVLAAHIHVQGARLPHLFRMSEQESIIFAEKDLPAGMAYVALGHIHQPQQLLEMPHVRYSGSIERLDLGERRDDKGVVLVEVGHEDRLAEPVFLPLEATPIYSVDLHSPLKEEIRQLREQYPDARRDLIHIQFTYTAGVDNLEESLRELEDIFPRWYYRHWTESGALGSPLTVGEACPARSFEDTIRDYLRHELTNYSDADREGILARAEALMREVDA